MTNIKLKNCLYTFYILTIAFEEDEIIEENQLNTLILKNFESIDSKNNSAKKLTDLIEFKLEKYFKNLPDNELTVEFKIGEVIKTDVSTSLIILKFIIENNDVFNITIFENEKKLKTISIKHDNNI